MAKEDDPLSEIFEDEDNEQEESNESDDDEGDDDDDDDDEDFEPLLTPESITRSERAKMESIFNKISSPETLVPLRVHKISIKGNTKTRESVIISEIQALKTATSVQELIQSATIANMRLQKLDIFDSVSITFDSGPPGTTNVVIHVVEANKPLTGDIGVFTKPEARSWSIEGSLKLKNLLGYADLWDASLSYGWDQASEVSAGVSLPRFMRLFTPVMARVSLISQDWLKFTSYKEQALGLSLGLLSTKNHDLAYNLSWRSLTDPSQMASKSIRRQLGHGLLSHLKYTFKIDKRNSPLRPTRGFAFVSASQLGGIFPDYRSLRFIRQEFDLRYALPLGFARSALNFGVAGGVIFPWGSEFVNAPTSIHDRFFLGGNTSPVCSLGGPTSLLGFKIRGLGPSELKREVKTNSEDKNSNTSERDFLGGDLAVTAFADLSFDLPLKVLRDSNIHAHAFACAGSLTKLTENSFREFSFQKYRDSFRSSAGFGLIIPTRLFRMEINYCYILKQHEHDRAKTGVQFSFSSPL
uniref:sorting and assembly machinery component 50 homolog B-like n=1 Tax=Erigeron canadensis TaxID=72917 RepID=UPI001CB909B4|nr:sorting and assembly machinery component 50 homolog B-like [Erigeron canadensis]